MATGDIALAIFDEHLFRGNFSLVAPDSIQRIRATIKDDPCRAADELFERSLNACHSGKLCSSGPDDYWQLWDLILNGWLAADAECRQQREEENTRRMMQFQRAT